MGFGLERSRGTKGLMPGFPTPGEAALSGFAPHTNATVIRADVDGDTAELLIRTDDDRDEVIRCIRREDGWYDVGDVGG
jgi:hypothetical protein